MNYLRRAAILLLIISLAPSAFSQGTAFTYQGRLADNGVTANGNYDIRFALYDTLTGGTQQGNLLTNSVAILTNGVFTVTLDFGIGIFNGADRWLEVATRTNGAASFTVLTPRQKVTPTPYATFAGNVNASGITGSIPPGNIANGSITGAMLAPGAVTSLGTPGNFPPVSLSANTNGYIEIGGGVSTAGLSINTGSPTLSLNPIAQIPQLYPSGPFYFYQSNITSIAVKGNLLMVGSYYSGTNSQVTFDGLTNGINPESFFVSIGNYSPFTNLAGIRSLAVSGTSNLLAVAASISDAVTLVNINNPHSPAPLAEIRNGVGAFTQLDGACGLAFSGNLLAIAAQDADAVTLVDVSNSTNPVFRVAMKNGQFGFNDLDGPVSLAFSGNILAVAARGGVGAVSLVDVSSPTSPVLRSVMKDGVGGFNDLAGAGVVATSSTGSLLAIAAPDDNAVTLVDISNPSSPVLRAVLKDGVGGFDYLANVSALAFSGTSLIIASFDDDAITVVDVSNPATPKLRGLARQGVNGVAFLHQPTSLAFSSTNLVVGCYGSSAFSIFTLTPQTVALNTTGWVGIGVTNPIAPLNVNGNVVVENATLLSLHADHVEIGTGAAATGDKAIALGYGATANALYSTALGYNAISQGAQGSTALGAYSIATGEYGSTAVGYEAAATGGGAPIAIGFGAQATDQSTIAVGLGAFATNQESLAVGVNAVASGAYAVALGEAIASGENSTSLGSGATASGESAIASGLFSQATGKFSLALGENATASGEKSVALGAGATATGRASLALGLLAKATNDGAFVFADAGPSEASYGLFSSAGDDTFNVRARGGVYFHTNTSLNFGSGLRQMLNLYNTNYGIGVQGNTLYQRGNKNFAWYKGGAHSDTELNAGGGTTLMKLDATSLTVNGTFVSASDRNLKENFAPVNPQAVLEKVAALPLTQWNYKEDAATRHLGPMAQDFYSAFNLGPDDRHITTVDADGVALAAIQGLNQKVATENQKSDDRLQKLESENADLKQRLEKLEHLLREKSTPK